MTQRVRDRENASCSWEAAVASGGGIEDGSFNVVLGAFRTPREAHRAAVLEKCGWHARAARMVMAAEGPRKDGNTADACRFVGDAVHDTGTGNSLPALCDPVDVVSERVRGSARVYSGTHVHSVRVPYSNLPTCTYS